MSEFSKSEDDLVDVAREWGDGEKIRFVHDQSNPSAGSRTTNMNRGRCCGWIVTAWTRRIQMIARSMAMSMKTMSWASRVSDDDAGPLNVDSELSHVYMCNHRNMNHLNSLFFAQMIWLATFPLPCNIECDWVKESCVEWCMMVPLWCTATIKFQSPAWFMCMCRPLGFLCSIMQSLTWKQGSTLPWPQWHLQSMT